MLELFNFLIFVKIFVIPVFILLLEIPALLGCILLIRQPHLLLKLPGIENSLAILIQSFVRNNLYFFLELTWIWIDEFMEDTVDVVAKNA